MKKAIVLFYLVFLQPPALVTWAGLIALMFLLFHLLGWREMTTVLSGTFPPGFSPPEAESRAVLYLVAWFATVVIAPVLVLAAAIDSLFMSRLRQSYQRRKIQGINSK